MTAPVGHWPLAPRWATPWPVRVLRVRALRAGVFAAAGLCLAVAAHRVGGGVVPGAAVLAAALAGLFLLGLAVTGKELSGQRIGVLVVGTQTLLHVGFMAATMRAASASGAGQPVRMSWAQMLFCSHGASAPSAAEVTSAVRGLDVGGWAAGTSAPVAHGGGPVTGLAAGMLAMHLFAAAGMAWWLRRGERLAWTMLRRVTDCLRLLFLDHVVAPRPAAQFVCSVAADLRPRQVWGSGLAGRGPPGPAVGAFSYA